MVKMMIKFMTEWGGLLALALMITLFGGWCTHIYWGITTESWLGLIAGALAAPLGSIHGIYLWFAGW